MTRLRPVPQTTPRAVGYVRVSMEREEMISPELQQASIEAYCTQRGYRLVDTIVELDVSGRTFARAGVQEAIERVERGDADVIVVWKVSRFGRTRRDWYVHADRIDLAGGSLESATESFDPLTSTGRLTRGMLVELAAWESDVKSEQWKETHAHRISRGVPHSPTPRFGYTYDRESGTYSPDPVTGPLLAQAYQRAVNGQPIRHIAAWLDSLGIKTTRGAPMHEVYVRKMLDSGFGAGFITAHGEHRPGSHEPVVSTAVFEKYRRQRAARAREPVRSRVAVHPVSGLVFCECGARMHRHNPKGDRAWLRCVVGCGHCYVRDVVVYDAVLAWLEREVAVDLDRAAEVKARQEARRAVAKADRAAIARQVREAEQSLTRLTEGWAKGLVPDDAYAAARESLTAQRAVLEERLAGLDTDADALRANAPRLARSIVRDWPTLAERDPAALREILARLVRQIIVKPGPPATTPGKVAIVARWE